MKKILFSLLLLFNLSAFGIDEPENPKEPEDISIELPEIPDPFIDIKTNSEILFKAKIFLSQSKAIVRTLSFSNFNIKLSNMEINLYEVKEIEIKKWKVTHISNDMYLFMPDKYLVKFMNRNNIELDGNIEILNTLVAEKERFYSFFYDFWISGKNKYYRWKNSKSVTFDYNLNNPIKNVVYKIEFIWD